MEKKDRTAKKKKQNKKLRYSFDYIKMTLQRGDKYRTMWASLALGGLHRLYGARTAGRGNDQPHALAVGAHGGELQRLLCVLFAGFLKDDHG